MFGLEFCRAFGGPTFQQFFRSLTLTNHLDITAFKQFLAKSLEFFNNWQSLDWEQFDLTGDIGCISMQEENQEFDDFW